MEKLSLPITRIRSHYDVVVVGSGYGGSITASRLARAGRSVCVLERGREIRPGEYPQTLLQVEKEVNITTPPEIAQAIEPRTRDAYMGNQTGMFNFHVHKDMNVLVGCGLGGTSLINASVSLEPAPAVFEDPVWPRELRASDDGRLPEDLALGFKRALHMLGANVYPDHMEPPAKQQAHRASAAALGAPWTKVPLNVTFQDRVNEAGVHQPACTLCGDCVTGCNYGSKNTLLMNYLPDARNFGAEIFTEVRVDHVSRDAQSGKYLVHYRVLQAGQEAFGGADFFVSADVVVLAAGTLGSTEILLRSRAAGLSVSDRLGDRFGGNGDVLGFAYNGDRKVHGVGFGARQPGAFVGPGPTITSMIDLRGQRAKEDQAIIEEGAIPGSLGPVLAGAFGVAAGTVGVNMQPAPAGKAQQASRAAESALLGPHRGAVDHSQTYLVMVDDDADGKMSLDNGGHLRIDWPGVGTKPAIVHANDWVQRTAGTLGAVYVKNPVWIKALQHPLITVHPLGGCAIGSDAAQGVVNHKGQVFSGTTGDAAYEGLYVADGAIIPRAVGVNPLLTISALAERNAALIAKDRGWTISEAPGTRAVSTEPARIGVRFTETMHGFFQLGELESYERGKQKGEATGCSYQFILTIQADDLDAMLSQPDHASTTVGTATAPALSPKPMMVTGGVFNLFVKNPVEANTHNMRYRFAMLAEDGKRYFLDGFKVVRHDKGFDVWDDNTTLYTTIYEGDSMEGRVLGKGILRLTPSDLAAQLGTVQVLGAKNAAERVSATARFGEFFCGTLFWIYGPLARPLAYLSPEAVPRQARPLRAGAPEFDELWIDDTRITLTRYRGGSKGPVLLAHGLGTSSRIFSIDTPEVNLVEYLYAHGYDVWLLDHRASTALPSAAGAYTLDDLAGKDYPAAIGRVRELSGARDVQVVAHGSGAAAFTMSVLKGLSGVRSAVLSQLGAHVVVPKTDELKYGLKLSSTLELLGLRDLSAYTSGHAGLKDRIMDLGMKLSPAALFAQCKNPVCTRIALVYGAVYEHSQLDDHTHAALSELFGTTGIKAFEHVAAMVRAGKVVDAAGHDVYTSHLDRMAFPVTLLHGENNHCFLLRSTEQTYEALRKHNNPALYTRHVIAGYGDTDCIIGKNAVQDVYPIILSHLEQTAGQGGK